MIKKILFPTIQFSISHSFALSLNVKQFYFTIDRTFSGATTLSGHRSDINKRVLCIPQSSKTGASRSNVVNCNIQDTSSNWPIDMILTGATTPSQSWPGMHGNDGVLRIPQSLSIIGASLSDCLFIPRTLVGRVLHFCWDAVGVFYNLNHLGCINI